MTEDNKTDGASKTRPSTALTKDDIPPKPRDPNLPMETIDFNEERRKSLAKKKPQDMNPRVIY